MSGLFIEWVLGGWLGGQAMYVCGLTQLSYNLTILFKT